MSLPAAISVVIPCYRVARHIEQVLAAIGPECSVVYVVDDACPEATGDHVEAVCRDARVRVLRHARNGGVGAATITGYRQALRDGADVVVKLDGDGQMDPALVPRLVQPILEGRADYSKGNRFFDLTALKDMPRIRLVGNGLLSFAAKLSSGYWNLFDPTNGFTAIERRVLEQLPLDKLSRGYFFESDLLFRLGVLRAVARDVPMPARYGDEQSNLSLWRVPLEFTGKHLVNTAKRIVYNYYLRNFTAASVELAAGLALLLFGVGFGVSAWREGAQLAQPQTSGTVMLAALPVILGVQLLLGFVSHDVQAVPTEPLHPLLRGPQSLATPSPSSQEAGASRRPTTTNSL